jgi:hypothetical protein
VHRAARVSLSAEELSRLRAWVDEPGTSERVRDRARILLWSAAGHSDREIASGLHKDIATVALWRRRYLLHGLAGALRDAPRPGRKPKHRDVLNDRILDATFNETPPRAARWSTRAMARRFGVSHMVVQRLWQSQGVGRRPAYRIQDRLASPQPPFVDLLGVILQPPTRIVIVGVELTGESRIVHVDPILLRVQSQLSGGHLLHAVHPDPDDLVGLIEGFQSLPSGPAGRRLQLANLLILLREIDERTSSTMRVHLLAEGRGATRDPRLAAWLRLHPRFVLHDLPTGAEWETEVGRFLHQWHSVPMRAGSFQGIPSFTRAVARFAGRAPLRQEGIVWSISEALDRVGPRADDRTVNPPPYRAPSGLARIGPAVLPSETPPNVEKFSLRTTGP